MTKLLLTIYLSETDMSGDLSLHEVLIRRLLHLEIAGATVTQGLMGYGRHGQVHRKRLFGVSDDKPIIISAVDNEARIRHALPELRRMAPQVLITVQEVEVA